jgi:hypothetical protein
MDDIYLPDDEELGSTMTFKRSPMVEEFKTPAKQTVEASSLVKVSFDRFVHLVANRSFLEVVERNKDEEVVLSTNLLTDLANAKRVAPDTRGPLLLLAGLGFGILLGYFFFNV